MAPYGIPVYCDPKQMSDMSIDLLLITFAISLKAQDKNMGSITTKTNNGRNFNMQNSQ